MYSTLLTSLDEGVFIITINRPEKLNALNTLVLHELDKAIDEVYDNPAIKSAIITGSGEKAFVAGADISEFGKMDAGSGEALAKYGHELMNKIENCSKPIVAAVNGFALGGGCELALACHFIYASDTAKFGQPEINLGIIPGYGGTQRLTQLVGKNIANELMLTGKIISAEEAKNYHMVNKICAPEELLPETKKTMQLIGEKAPLAAAKIISCVNHFNHTLQGYDYEIKQFGECFSTEDMMEGTTAFTEKRKPVFTGK